MATSKVKNATGKAAKKLVKKLAERSFTSEQYRTVARKAEAVQAVVRTAESGIPIKGSNTVQALGQGALAVKINGERKTTGSNELKGAFAQFDGANSAAVTRAVTGADYPLEAAFTGNGLARIYILSTEKLCPNPADQAMVDAIWAAIAKRYPEAVDASPAAGRKRTGEKREVSNPLFA